MVSSTFSALALLFLGLSTLSEPSPVVPLVRRPATNGSQNDFE